MKTSLISGLKSVAKKVLSVLLLSTFLGGGMLTALADGTPSFNNLPDDYPTLQVAKAGQSWSTSTSAAVGEVVNLLVWVHNTNPGTTATNTVAKVSLPATVANSHVATATVSASNANAVSGTSTINVGSSTRISYVAGSAKLLKNVGGQMTEVNWSAGQNPDSIVTSGVNLQNIDGCWQFAQAVRLQVRIEGANPAINTNKKVELSGGAIGFADSANASPNDVINYKIFLQNTGNGTGVAPLIVDTLDSRLTYVPASSYMLIKRNNVDVKVPLLDNLIKFEGKKITWAFEDMGPTADKALYLIFQARLAANTSFPVGVTSIPNCAISSFVGVSANTNCVTVNVTRQAEPVVTFSLRKEITNLTLNDNRWYDNDLSTAAPGDLVGYRLVLVNTGNTPATNVTLKDILPAELTFAGNVTLYNRDHQSGLAISGDTLVKNGYVFNTIVNGNDNTQTITFAARITNTCVGAKVVTNTAQVIYQGAVKAQDSASLNFTCTRGLHIIKDVKTATGQYVNDGGIVAESQVLTYRVQVQNSGNTVAVNPIVRDVLPALVTYVPNSLAIDGEFMSADIQTAFFAQGMILTNLTSGLGKTITYQVRVLDCPNLGDTSIVNTAFAKANGITEISDTAKVTVRVNRPTL